MSACAEYVISPGRSGMQNILNRTNSNSNKAVHKNQLYCKNLKLI